ncbi:hypothetical protein NKH16_24690 [Mesorhizobium sp. M1307]|uniref:hypothetical protein n=1 Tax=Mesorhizobium sp. M1307 TaxID=2957079 RepID=UPI00333D3BF3
MSLPPPQTFLDEIAATAALFACFTPITGVGFRIHAVFAGGAIRRRKITHIELTLNIGKGDAGLLPFLEPATDRVQSSG